MPKKVCPVKIQVYRMFLEQRTGCVCFNPPIISTYIQPLGLPSSKNTTTGSTHRSPVWDGTRCGSADGLMVTSKPPPVVFELLGPKKPGRYWQLVISSLSFTSHEAVKPAVTIKCGSLMVMAGFYMYPMTQCTVNL